MENLDSLFNFILFFSISTAFPFYYREILSYINLPFLHTLLFFLISTFLSLILNCAFCGFRPLFNFIFGSFLTQQTNPKTNFSITKIPSASEFSNHYQLLFLMLILSVSYTFAFSLTFLCFSISELDLTVISTLSFTQLFSTFFNYFFFNRKLPILGFFALLSIVSGLFTILYNFNFLHSNFCYTCNATNVSIQFQNHFGDKSYQILTQILASFFISLSNFLFAKTIIHANEKFLISNNYNTMQNNFSNKFRYSLNIMVHIIQYWVMIISTILSTILYFLMEFQAENSITFKSIFNIDYLTLIFFGVALNELKVLSEVKLLEVTSWNFSISFTKLRVLPVLLINLIVLNSRFKTNLRLPTENSQLMFQFPLNIKKNYKTEQVIGTFFILVGTVFLSLISENNYSFISTSLSSLYSSDDTESQESKMQAGPPTVDTNNSLPMQIKLNSQEDEFSSLLQIEDKEITDHDNQNKEPIENIEDQK